MPPTIMIVFCFPDEVEAIMDEYTDWHKEGLHIRFHGTTSKCDDAFIILEWINPIPERFIRKLQHDDDVSDFIIFDVSQVLPTQA